MRVWTTRCWVVLAILSLIFELWQGPRSIGARWAESTIGSVDTDEGAGHRATGAGDTDADSDSDSESDNDGEEDSDADPKASDDGDEKSDSSPTPEEKEESSRKSGEESDEEDGKSKDDPLSLLRGVGLAFAVPLCGRTSSFDVLTKLSDLTEGDTLLRPPRLA